MYQAMMELTEKQADDNTEEEDIRITAWRYYTYDNQTNTLSSILGNGMPALGVSRWGIIMDAETLDQGVFWVDVGWAGFYWLFGAFSTIGLLALMFTAIFRRKPPQEQFLTYSLIFYFVTSFASGPPVIYWQIVGIMVVLYMVYRKKDNAPENDTQQISSNSNNTEYAGDRPHYPQL